MARDDGLPYWQMNLKITTYFLKRYDAEFDPTDWARDETLSERDENRLLTTHALLQQPTADRGRYPSLTKELELQLKQRVAKYFDSRL